MPLAAAWERALYFVRSPTGRREVLGSTTIMVGLSTAARALFALAFAAIMVARFAPPLSVELFQLLLLQTIFVTFVSGSGYVRAVSANDTEDGVTRLLRGYALFVLITVAVIVALEVAVIPRDLIDRFISPDRWKIYALITGGVATGFHGILQGAIVRDAGPGRVFLPVAGVSVAFTLSLTAFFVADLPGSALLVAYVAYQGMTLLVFALANRASILPLLGNMMRQRTVTPLGDTADALGFGGVNTAVLLIFFLFRELWSEQVDPHLAEAAFFAVRISETYLGILFYVAASSPIFEKFRHARVIRAASLIRAAGLTIAAFVGLSLAIYAATSLEQAMILLVLCLGLQLASDVLRVPGSLATLFELQYGTPLSFALVALPATIAAALAALYMTPLLALFSFYFFQLLMSAGQIGSALVNRAIYESKRLN